MTLERQKWWDSLPTEEKRVRCDIKELRTQIAWHKIGLNSSCGHETEMRKFALRMNKRLIKALRKQIAMRPIAEHLMFDYYYCPSCRRYVEEDTGYFIDLADKCCRHCGQKLRWE